MSATAVTLVGINSLAGIETITYPGFSEDVTRRRGIRLNFFSQVTNKHAQIFVLLNVITTPQSGE